MTAYDRGMRELLEECRSSAFDAKEYSLCDRIDAALRTPIPPIFDAFCTAREQRDEARAEVEMLRGVGCMEDGDGPCGACRKCAYQRGAAAMREAAMGAAWHSAAMGVHNKIRDLPDPEDKQG